MADRRESPTDRRQWSDLGPIRVHVVCACHRYRFPLPFPHEVPDRDLMWVVAQAPDAAGRGAYVVLSRYDWQGALLDAEGVRHQFENGFNTLMDADDLRERGAL